MFKKGPKDCFEVMIDLSYILFYEFKKLIPPSFPESEKGKADRGHNNWRVLLRTSVSSQRLHVDLRFDKRSSSEMIYKITYGCPFGRVSSDFLKLDKVVISYQTGS